jgi:hypothetical protein
MPKTTSLLRSCARTLLLVAVFAQAGETRGQAKTKAAPPDKVELAVVVQAIKDALTESEKYDVPAFPRFQSATVSVATTVEKEGTAGVKFYVFNLGGTRNVSNASTLTFELLPPPPPPRGAHVQSFNPVEIKNALVKQIAGAKLGFVSANSQTKALQADKVEVQIQFTVKAQGSGGVDTGPIFPIGLTLSGKYSQQSGNVIKLVFSNKAQ